MKAEDFPQETYAHAVDTNGQHSYSTPLRDKTEIDENVEHYKKVRGVTRIRVATYRLASVEEIEVGR